MLTIASQNGRTMPIADSVLVCRDLLKRYGERDVVIDVSFYTDKAQSQR